MSATTDLPDLTDLSTWTSHQHVNSLRAALDDFDNRTDVFADWGARLAPRLAADGRLLVAGNGGSAAQAQHCTAELVGRFLRERRPMSAICLTSETSSLTALLNDYGGDEVFARQVEAHGRPGDVLLLLSTSGRSPNVLAAAERARELGIEVWALTGALPNPLADRSDEAFPITSDYGPTVQELHLVAVHLLCAAIDQALASGAEARGDAA